MVHTKKSQYNPYNFLVCFLVSLGQIAFGHPASIISMTLGEPPFLLYMGLIDAEGNETSNAEALIGTFSGIFQVPTLLFESATQEWFADGIRARLEQS